MQARTAFNTRRRRTLNGRHSQNLFVNYIHNYAVNAICVHFTDTAA